MRKCTYCPEWVVDGGLVHDECFAKRIADLELQVREMRQAVQDVYGRLVNMMDTDAGWQVELSERLEEILGKCAGSDEL